VQATKSAQFPPRNVSRIVRVLVAYFLQSKLCTFRCCTMKDFCFYRAGKPSDPVPRFRACEKRSDEPREGKEVEKRIRLIMLRSSPELFLHGGALDHEEHRSVVSYRWRCVSVQWPDKISNDTPNDLAVSPQCKQQQNIRSQKCLRNILRFILSCVDAVKQYCKNVVPLSCH